MLILSPFIFFRDDSGRKYSIVTGDHISTYKYTINYVDSLGDTHVLDGVGDPDFPETFETADGKTVTVIGGIITDIS